MAIRVLGINGSLRATSTAGRALQLLVRMLEAEDVQCEVFEISSLPLLDGRPDDQYPASLAAWRAAVSAADGLVVVTPSYHGALPGALKNALDFIDAPHAGGKPFALVGVAGGDAEPGVTDVARVLRHIGGIAAIPDVVISRSGEHWGPGDTPANPAVAVALQKVAGDLIRLCHLRQSGQLPEP